MNCVQLKLPSLWPVFSVLVFIAGMPSTAQQPTVPVLSDLYSGDRAVDAVAIDDGKSTIYCRERVDPVQRKVVQSLWRFDSESREHKALEHGEPNAFSPQLSPDKKWILFLSTRPFESGLPAFDPVPAYSDVAADIWMMPVGGGRAIPLGGPQKPYGRVITDRFYGRVAFSPNGKHLAFVADDRKERRSASEKKNNVIEVRDDQGEGYEGYGPMQIWVADLLEQPTDVAANKIMQVTSDDFWYGDPQWARDGSYLVVHANRTNDQESVRYSINHNYDLWRIYLSDLRLEQLTNGIGPEFSPRISPDGRRLVCLSSPRNGPHSDVYNLYVIDLTLQSIQGRFLFNHHGVSPDTKLEALPSLPPVNPLPDDCWRDNQHVSYTALKRLQSVTQCINVDSGQLTDIAEPSGNARPTPKLPPIPATIGPRLRAPDKEVKWTSIDGTEVDGFLTTPHESIAQPPYKLLLIPHGGPHHRASGGSGFDVQFFAGQGFAVFQPNFRGSTGYGLKFLDANRNDLGGGDMQDILFGIEHLAGQGLIDRQRQFVYGVSYGGFMTTWLIGHTNQFRAAVAQNAVTDLNAMWHLSDLQSWTEWEMCGLPWQVAERMKKFSPLTYVNRVETPTLILHSQNDRRCPIAMGHMFHRALKARGVTTGMVIYPDEGHGIRQLPHREDVLQRAIDWFNKHDLAVN